MRSAAAVGSAGRVRCAVVFGCCLVFGAACRRAPTGSTLADASEAASASASAAAEIPAPPPPTPAPPPPAPPPPPEQAGTCPAGPDDTTGLLVSPIHAYVGAPVRILTATLVDPEPLAFRLETPKGEPIDADVVYRGGIPAMVAARLVP